MTMNRWPMDCYCCTVLIISFWFIVWLPLFYNTYTIPSAFSEICSPEATELFLLTIGNNYSSAPLGLFNGRVEKEECTEFFGSITDCTWMYSCVLNAITYQTRCVWQLILLHIQTGWCSILDFGAAMKTVTVINQQVWICQYNSRYILFVQIRIQDYEISSGRYPTWRTISSIICLFESSTCFKQLCAHPQEDNCINTTYGIITLC
jgi:hypothetical protein